jgi:hypothetical protein
MGMSDVVADLQDLELTGLEISGGASRLDIKLPRPEVTVRVRIGAGASNLELVRPAGVPVRVRIGGGASQLAIDEFRGNGRIDWRSPDYDQLEAGTTSRSVRERVTSRSGPEELVDKTVRESQPGNGGAEQHDVLSLGRRNGSRRRLLRSLGQERRRRVIRPGRGADA